MSQIDLVIYLPLLFWFSILFFVLYFVIFTSFLSFFFITLKTRIFYFEDLLTSYNGFLQSLDLIFLCYFNVSLKHICFILSNYLHSTWYFSVGITLVKKYIKS